MSYHGDSLGDYADYLALSQWHQVARGTISSPYSQEDYNTAGSHDNQNGQGNQEVAGVNDSGTGSPPVPASSTWETAAAWLRDNVHPVFPPVPQIHQSLSIVPRPQTIYWQDADRSSSPSPSDRTQAPKDKLTKRLEANSTTLTFPPTPQTSANKDEEDNRCGICFEKLVDTTTPHLTAVKLNVCGHALHKECLLPYFVECKRTAHWKKEVCPFCRRKVFRVMPESAANQEDADSLASSSGSDSGHGALERERVSLSTPSPPMEVGGSNGRVATSDSVSPMSQSSYASDGEGGAGDTGAGVGPTWVRMRGDNGWDEDD